MTKDMLLKLKRCYQNITDKPKEGDYMGTQELLEFETMLLEGDTVPAEVEMIERQLQRIKNLQDVCLAEVI
jgi:hypothetical protein